MFLEGLIEQRSRIRGRYRKLNGKGVEFLRISDGSPDSLHSVIRESQNIVCDHADTESMAEVDDRLLLFLAWSLSEVLQQHFFVGRFNAKFDGAQASSVQESQLLLVELVG